ncbi:hypothetical protein ACFL1R_01185 [Candidatus Latescibacterota bacterium]
MMENKPVFFTESEIIINYKGALNFIPKNLIRNIFIANSGNESDFPFPSVKFSTIYISCLGEPDRQFVFEEKEAESIFNTIVEHLKLSGLKKCPFCAEMIKQEAVVCRYCKRELPG